MGINTTSDNKQYFRNFEFVFKYRNGKFPYNDCLKRAGFDNAVKEEIPEDYKLSDLFTKANYSKTEFRNRLKEGAVELDNEKIYTDSILPFGCSKLKLGRTVIDVWNVSNTKTLHPILDILVYDFYKPIINLFKKRELVYA